MFNIGPWPYGKMQVRPSRRSHPPANVHKLPYTWCECNTHRDTQIEPTARVRLRSEILSARIIWLRGTLAIIEYHANLHQMTQRIRRQSTAAAAAAPSLKVEHTLAIIRFVNHYYRRLCVLPFVFAAQFTRPKPGGGNAIIVFMEVRSAMLQLPESGRPPLS